MSFGQFEIILLLRSVGYSPEDMRQSRRVVIWTADHKTIGLDLNYGKTAVGAFLVPSSLSVSVTGLIGYLGMAIPITCGIYHSCTAVAVIERSGICAECTPYKYIIMYQLGRRNLTDEQRTVLIGKMYEARKHAYGGDRKSSRQNDDLNNSGRISDQIEKELGIGKKES